MTIYFEEYSVFNEFITNAGSTLFGGLISLFIAILVFRFEKKKDKEFRENDSLQTLEAKRKEIDRQWYLNVIVNPNLELVNSFFEETKLMCVESTRLLDSLNGSKINDYKTTKAIRIKLFKDKLRTFEYDFIYIVKSYSNNLSEQLMDSNRELEDQVLNFIDNIINVEGKVDDEQLIQKISTSKAKFYYYLNMPIKNE